MIPFISMHRYLYTLFSLDKFPKMELLDYGVIDTLRVFCIHFHCLLELEYWWRGVEGGWGVGRALHISMFETYTQKTQRMIYWKLVAAEMRALVNSCGAQRLKPTLEMLHLDVDPFLPTWLSPTVAPSSSVSWFVPRLTTHSNRSFGGCEWIFNGGTWEGVMWGRRYALTGSSLVGTPSRLDIDSWTSTHSAFYSSIQLIPL